jgi:hypothetical protein
MSATFKCGHPKTPENSYSYSGEQTADGYPRQQCRTCIIERSRKRYKPKEQTARLLQGFGPCALEKVWR